jgi:uncharacterized protein YjbJ (UPF0337 family)
MMLLTQAPGHKLAGTSGFVKEGNKMKSSTENQIAGKVHEVKGKIKEKVGRLTNDPDLEGEGIGEKIAGKVQKKIGQLEKVVEKP